MRTPPTYPLCLVNEDLYAILGIERGATADQVKAAYRKLARRLHPDVNKDPDAQAQFAKLQQAYEVLSDADKRRRYDRTGRTDAGPDPFAGGGFRADVRGSGFDADEFSEMFDAFFRGRPGTQPPPRSPPRQPPRDLNIKAPLSLDLETVDKGGKVKARTPAGEVVEVTIPAAVAPGAVLRVKGKGERDATGRQGDLLLEIRLKPHTAFTRGAPGRPDPASLDLTTRADVTIADATLGGEIRIDRLGQTIHLTVPPSTPSGRALRARGKGLTNAAGRSGDLFVEIRIVPPDHRALTDEDKRALRHIAAARTPASPADA